jgi:16S rRNA (guanine966-N2)-methyltransferase
MRGLDIRPTSDRLRETLFDIVTSGNPQALENSIWLDLFAGTGAVGIEALSRGAVMVYFVESSKPAGELIRANLGSLQVRQGFRVVQKQVVRAISELEPLAVRPNYIFLDPPYRMHGIYGETLDALSGSALSEGALVIAEHERRFDPGAGFASLARVRKIEQGDAALSFYRRSLEPGRS